MKTSILSMIALAILSLTSCEKEEIATPSVQSNKLLTSYNWQAYEYQFNPDTTKPRNTSIISITGTTSNGDSTIMVDPIKRFNIFGAYWYMAFIDSTQYISIYSADTPVIDKNPAFYSGWKVRFKRLN